MKTDFEWNHIILADDDDDDCSFFTEALSVLQPGLKLSVENDGVKLMQHLEMPPQPDADAIFLDLNMPAKSGMDCLQDIRRHKRFKDSVVIMITTSSSHSDIENSYRNGANFFITKPVNFTDLCSLISKAFTSIVHYGAEQPPRKDFVLSV